jgi:flagellar L-ring protein precursor FlgH
MWSSRFTSLLLAAALLGAGTGCVEHALMETFDPTEYPLPRTSSPPPTRDGGIWRGGTQSGSFLYFDRKARGVGDLVTVVMLENLRAAGSANTNLGRDSEIAANVTTDLGLTDLIQAAAREILDLFGVSFTGSTVPAGQELNVVESNTSTDYEGDGTTNRESRFSGVVTCRVVDVLPGGIYHIYGKRKMLVNHELQLVTVEGLVRRKDINIDNTVASTQLADAKLTFDGIGVIDDKQRPPLLARVIDWIYPF